MKFADVVRRVDSLTQAALGAAVGYAGWHRSMNRKALLWGAAVGTMPDLDIIAFPWMDAVERLYWHRGPSHGFLFVTIASAAIGLLLAWLYSSRGLARTRAVLVTGLILVTHVAIDLFTVYGTQILAPFSRHGFGTNNLFIIDPLYTGPLLIGIVGALGARSVQGKIKANLIGLVVSTVYVGWSFFAQAQANAVFYQALERQGVAVTASQTSATPFNTVLWRHLAVVEGGFLIGYWSLLDGGKDVQFQYVPQRAELMAPVVDTREFKVLDWFSQGYWVADDRDGTLRLCDLRFGELRPAAESRPEQWVFIFAWTLSPTAKGTWALQSAPEQPIDRGEAMKRLWRRLQGEVDAW